MISVKPGSDGARVLACVVGYPGELGTTAIAALLWPPPRRVTPFRDHADLRQWQADKAAHKAAGEARVSRSLEGLRRLKLVEARSAPTLAEGFLRRVQVRGVDRALDFANADQSPRVKLKRRHRLLVDLMLANGGTASSPLYTDIAARGRAWSEAYADLVRIGVIVPPSCRWPSAAGVALVASWSTP